MHDVNHEFGAAASGQAENDAVRWRDPLEGLPLKVASDPSWAGAALSDLDATLSDHAHCEQKAAASGLSMIGRYAEHKQILRPMIALTHEETHHFRQVLELIEQRGGALTRPKKDRYVGKLREACFTHQGGLGALGDALLVNGLIEARSCERFRLLADALNSNSAEHPHNPGSAEDPHNPDSGEDAHSSGSVDLDPDDRARLGLFYARLAGAEGRHWETFFELACEFYPEQKVRARLEQLAELEAEIIRAHPVQPRMH